MKATQTLITQFAENAQKAGAQVSFVSAALPELAATIKGLVKDQTILYCYKGNILPQVFDHLKEDLQLADPADEWQMRNLPFGICEAFAGVARTGSVCVRLGSNLTAAVSLLPFEHIVLLQQDRLVWRPRDVVTFPEAQADNFIFVTGPSATADMGELVRGAHGPGKLHILLLHS